MKIFITGATGYIGGSVAARLVEAGHEVSGLVRTADKAAELSARGIKPLLGSLDDRDILVTHARWADAVVNTADSDHKQSIETLVASLEGSGKILIHTSGTSLVGDDARGEYASDRVFVESDLSTLAPGPEKLRRFAIDKLVIDSGRRGIRSTVLCNSLIYGTGLGLHQESVQLPRLIEQANKSGVVRHVGKGRNIWSNVHIADVADLYLLALDRAPAGSFYFVENGSASFAEMTNAIARSLGLAGPEDWPHAEAVKEWGYEHATYGLGCNSRVNASKARSELGWRPKHSSVIDYLEHELAPSESASARSSRRP